MKPLSDTGVYSPPVSSPAHPLRLYKKEKLCSQTAIDMLFAARTTRSDSMLFYPLRAVWRRNDGRYANTPVQFVISVPKKRLRHAVDRVTMRRRIREAYRLLRHRVTVPGGARYDIMFVFVGRQSESYALVSRAMRRILDGFAHAIAQPAADGDTPTPAQ